MDEDQSFIVEGLIVHNCKWFCRCHVKHKIVRMAVPLTERQAAALERRIPTTNNAAEGLAANELSVRERELLDRIAGVGGRPFKQTEFRNAGEARTATKLAQRGHLIKEKIDGRFVYRIPTPGGPPVVPPVEPPVVVPVPPPPPIPGPLIQPRNPNLTRRQLEVFQKIVTSPTPVRLSELTEYEGRIAKALVRMGELERSPGRLATFKWAGGGGSGRTFERNPRRFVD